MFYCLQENKRECMEIFSIFILIALEDTNDVKNASFSEIRKNNNKKVKWYFYVKYLSE